MSAILRILFSLTFCVNVYAKPTLKGLGSISYKNPENIALPPKKIYATDNLKGPIPTNDWWSSILWEKFSSNLFPHPLALNFDKSGLRVFYPGAKKFATEMGVIAGMPIHSQDLTIGANLKSPFTEALAHDYSDWFVTTQLGVKEKYLRFTYGHGSPFIYLEYQDIAPEIKFNVKPNIWSMSPNVIGLTSDQGNHYGLFIPRGNEWNEIKNNKITIKNSKSGFLTLAILPNKDLSTLKLFNKHAHNHVVNTKVNWKYNESKSTVTASYSFEMKSVCPSNKADKTLTALYPHQWRRSKSPTLNQSYQCVRGVMKLLSGNSFEVNYDFPGVLPCLPLKVEALEDDLLQIASNKNLARDTYWAGKALGNLATASAIAETNKHHKIAEQIRTTIKSELQDWFTYDNKTGDKHFFYDANWSTLIGIPPSYGSAKEINDHHFHYGYFLKAIAEITRMEPEWLKSETWKPIINLLIDDIANSDRQNESFPFLRNYDPYAGHSWASGHARFADGNNQESSSESMNAWTGLILFGQFIKDEKIRDLGIFLYSSELAAIEEYWFDVYGENHPNKISSPSLAMIWGGKGTYETWFSNDAHCKTGINILPIHGGSLYLGRFPNFVKNNHDFTLKEMGGRWSGWPSIMLSYEALNDAESSWKNWESYGKTLTLDSGNTRANTIHWIQNLRALGQIQKDITCNHPISSTFKSKAGTISHVVYLNGKEPKEMKFSNGVSFQASPGKFTIKKVE